MSSGTEVEGEKGFTCREWLVICGVLYVVYKVIQVGLLLATWHWLGWPAWCCW